MIDLLRPQSSLFHAFSPFFGQFSKTLLRLFYEGVCDIYQWLGSIDAVFKTR